MSSDVISAAIILIPVVLLVLLRINAVVVFLSLCLGSVLVAFVVPDLSSLTSLFSAKAPSVEVPDNDWIGLGLLLLPAFLTAIFMIRTVHGSSKQLLNVLPAIGVGLLGALLVIPLLPPEASDMLLEATLWQQAENIQGTIVGATAVVCLLVLWLQRPSSGGSKHGKKHKS